MLKFITGFLLGAFAAIAFTHWFSGAQPETESNRTGLPIEAEGSAKSRQHVSTGNNDIVSDAGEAMTDVPERAKAAENVDTSGPVHPVSNSRAATPRTDATPAQQTGRAATNPVQESARGSNTDKYPAEIADMIENSVDRELQAQYEADEREESWATYMEGQLAAYFAQKPALAQFYFSLIDCRTSICSVHALGYGPDALTQWNSATADLVSQPWFEFKSMSLNRRNPQPDVLGIVLIVIKKTE